MTACLVPACAAQSLDLGVWAFLCLEHALEAQTGRRAAPDRPDLRGRCWGEGLTCHMTAVTITPHGGYCREHAPPQPKLTQRGVDADAERAEQLAVLAVMNAFSGAKVETIRPNLQAPQYDGPTKTLKLQYLYGPTEEVPPAEWGRGLKMFTNAATEGKWDFRVYRALRHDRVLLRAWKGSFLMLAWWTEGEFGSAGLQQSKGFPVWLNSEQARRLLRAT